MFRRDWEPAEGTIIDRREKRGGATGSDASLMRFLVEVRPPTGQSFRLELGIPGFGANFRAPMVGDVVNVLSNPAHTKARFDTSDPRLSWKTERDAKKKQFDAELGEQGNTPGDPSGPE
jgi:hypothetical protein